MVFGVRASAFSLLGPRYRVEGSGLIGETTEERKCRHEAAGPESLQTKPQDLP